MQTLDLKAIGARIKTLRKELELKQDEFGEEVGVNMKTISLIENGHRKPSQEVLSVIQTKYNVNLDWISSGKGDKTSNKKINNKSPENVYAKVISIEIELAQLRKMMEQILDKLK